MKNVSSKITLLLLFAVALLFAGCAPSLTQAIYPGDIKEIERLIAAGADVNGKKNDTTPLEAAACIGNKEIAELLISKGADVNAKDDEDNTPLHYAAFCKRGKKKVAELLISKGAVVNARNKFGQTPLDIAKEKGHTSIVSLLQNDREMAKLRAISEPSSLAEEVAFAETALSYRAAAVKPTLPEEARKFAVQAENAIRDKQFEKAAELYKEALKIAPWWPEGHSDRALVLGELFRYRDAIREMKRYLTLVPDAPDARAAQDRIYQWEGELK